MSDPVVYLPSTTLRRSYERARSTDHGTQIQECADLLSNPELLMAEIVDAFSTMESFNESTLTDSHAHYERDDEPETLELSLEHFYEEQNVEVLGPDGFSFRCLATDVTPMPEFLATADGPRDGFDYVALRDELEANPIFGVAQSEDDNSAYPVLLRLLSCLTEILPADCFTRVNRNRFKGAIPSDARFDLQMVIWREAELGESESALCELARDLAEVARSGMEAYAPLAGRIGTIRCLSMDPRQFQSQLEPVWQI